MESKEKRLISIDIIRNVALICVVTGHFFLHNGYYQTPMIGKRMFLMTLIRSMATISVPLFLMITGYLMNKKKLSKKYYKGLVKIICIYLIASIICLLYKKFYLGENIGLYISLQKLLFYNAANYGWYIEMYIGLFLLIPFLNLIYNNLENRKQKLILIRNFDITYSYSFDYKCI